jgi:tetratricopeptide (TPR) repeat protein/transcriptional regulator with XRE-family HTH domain
MSPTSSQSFISSQSSNLSSLPKHPNNIGKAIKRHHWRLDKVAQLSGIPRRTLIDYCAGRTAVPPERLEALSRCLSYPISYLVPRFREAYLLTSGAEQAKDEQALLRLRTHCEKHPTDENTLRELIVMLAMHGKAAEIELYYARLLKELNSFTSRGPEPSTSALVEELRQALTQGSPHEQKTPAVPSRRETLASASSDQTISEPSQSASPQGILIAGAEANTQNFDANNLRDCYLVSSTDIVPSLKIYGSLCQEQLTTCRQQIDIYETIEQRGTMSDEHIRDLSQITRRDLFMLASVSSSLLINMRRGWPPAGVLEEFLSEVTASVTTCWYLLQRSDGLSVVEWAVPQYLPELVVVVKHSSLQRKRAAYLAAQGFLLLNLIALHRVRFSERVTYGEKAVQYAHESGDLTLLVASLIELSNAFFTNGHLGDSLRTYLQAEDYSKKLSGFLRSKVLAQLSQAHARQGNSEGVLQCMDEAYTTFTEADSETPIFLRTAYGLFETILFEGLSTFDLGSHAKDQGKLSRARQYWADAAVKFGKMEKLPSGLDVPVRIAAEVLIAQALAYAKARNMEGFLTTFEKGAKLAKELGSEKRRQEAGEALKAALEQWPNDGRITGVWELLV